MKKEKCRLQRSRKRGDRKVTEEPGEGRGDHCRALRSFESLVAEDRQDWRWEVSRATEFQNGTEVGLRILTVDNPTRMPERRAWSAREPSHEDDSGF